jgi:lincosamide nucleotidyltransferase B/F
VLPQERLIARVRDVCRDDERLDAALMYGSFVTGEGDVHSDIEFWLFFAPEHHAAVRPREWCERIAPVRHLVRNEFGTDVAFFAGLLRGEFHFASAAEIPSLCGWPGRGGEVDDMIVLDRHGMLRRALAEVPVDPPIPATSNEVETLCGRFANWLVLTHHLLDRGEGLRAWDALGHVHRHLVWMTRLTEDRTGHWLTPSRAAERDLPQAVTSRLRQTTATAGTTEIRGALRTAWSIGRDEWTRLSQRYGFEPPTDLFLEIDER